jgi:hypothetical protein
MVGSWRNYDEIDPAQRRCVKIGVDGMDETKVSALSLSLRRPPEALRERVLLQTPFLAFF